MIKGIELDNGNRVKIEDFNNVQPDLTDLPKPILEIIRPYINKLAYFNSYAVGEINNCLRRSYWERVEGHYEKISDLLRSSVGRAVHQMFLSKFDVKEKTVKFQYQISRQNVILVGKIDAYDFDTKTLIDLKTVKNATNNYLPRPKDVSQLKYFWSLLCERLPAMKIEKLQIIYVDRNGNHKTVNIEKENMIEEMKNRVSVLHNALLNRIVPNGEESYDCNYCPFKQKCNIKEIIVKNVFH